MDSDVITKTVNPGGLRQGARLVHNAPTCATGVETPYPGGFFGLSCSKFRQLSNEAKMSENDLWTVTL